MKHPQNNLNLVWALKDCNNFNFEKYALNWDIIIAKQYPGWKNLLYI